MAESLPSESLFKLKNIPKLFGVRREEEPRFYVIKKDHDFQVRKYRPFFMSQVIVKGSLEQAVQIGTQRLKSYLFGGNSTHDRIPMTLPILQSRGVRESTYSISFILPHKYKMDTLPLPKDSHIKIHHVPTSIVASLRFSGAISLQLIEEKTRELEAWIGKQQGYEVVSDVTWADYDATFVFPFFRRNEVLLTLRVGEKMTRSH